VTTRVEVARSISKALDDEIDFDTMLQANQAIMIDTSAREETKTDQTTQTKDMKRQITKLVAKDHRKRNDENFKSVGVSIFEVGSNDC
jgi:hypothetical protein